MSIRYQQSIFKADFDKNTVDSTRKIKMIIASEATGHKQHRNRFQYNWSNWVLDNYNANPIVGYQHGVWGDDLCIKSSPDDVIAKSFVFVDNFNGIRSLISDTEFEPREINEQADKIFNKIKFGSLNAASTGVLPIGLSKQEVRNDKKEIVDRFWSMEGQELAEWSVVHIPADPKALRQSLKSRVSSAIPTIASILGVDVDDVERMKVRDVIDGLISKKLSHIIEDDLEEIEQELSGPDPNLNNYLQKLNKLKNGQVKK